MQWSIEERAGDAGGGTGKRNLGTHKFTGQGFRCLKSLWRRKTPFKSEKWCQGARDGKVRASHSTSAFESGASSTVDVELEIREARKDDWWQVAEIHCRSFYPRATCLLGVLLRFDRIDTLKNGQGQGDLEDVPGNFACFGAWLSDRGMNDLGSAEGIFRAQAYKRMPQFLQIFVSRPLRANFDKTPEERGMVGSVIVDSLGEYVPPRRLKGFSEERPGIAYVSNLAVERNFRRRGIGRKLLAHAIQTAQDWGCHAILLQCDPKNQGARKMYKEAGFRHVSYEPHYLQFLEGRVGTRLELMLKKLGATPVDSACNT